MSSERTSRKAPEHSDLPAGEEPAFGPYGHRDHRFEETAPDVQRRLGGPQEPYYNLWHRPRKRFAFAGDDGINVVVEGADMTLDIVLRWHISDPDLIDENLGVDYDEAVFEDERLVAVITRRDGHPPLVRRLDVPLGPNSGGPRR